MELDRTQRIIVESNSRKIVVVAGAGSGKTAVLTQRIRHLVQVKGVSPSDITAITFTNMAADEMKERLSDIKGIEDMFVGTIHSFANRILKDDGRYYKILTDDLYSEIVQELIDKYCTYLKKERFIEYVDLVYRYKRGEANVSRDDVTHFFESEEIWEYELLNREYVDDTELSYPESVYTVCRKRGIITFDELIIKARASLNNYGSIRYLFVDEYQDVGNLEDNFIRSLEADNVFLVGDDWQSIYGFKGANVAIFKDYVQSKDWKVYHLNNNYRNSVGVSEFAQKIIGEVDNRLDKRVVIKNLDKGNVRVDEKKSLEMHLNGIKMSKKYNKWFILTRTRKDLNVVLDKCKEVGLPALTFSKSDFSLEEMRELMSQNVVKVLTVHASKGLEADNVLLYGNFPVKMEKSGCEDPRKRERKFEERRIMYVGVTRAKNRIVVLN